VMVGASGAGKSSFARRHFKPTEVISSDACRGLVADDENDQAATPRAFELLHFIARKRLEAGRLTVIDSTNVQPEARKPLIQAAREFHCLPVAIVLDLPERLAHERNRARPDRNFGPHVIRQQSQQLRRSLRTLEREGFRRVHILKSQEEVEAAEIVREPLWNNLKHERGPFDIIGDIHGCFDELVELLALLGYQPSAHDASWRHPGGRKLIFLGDLVDRGPKTPEVLQLAMASVHAGAALCVPGNHDIKLMRKLRGKNVQITHGLAESLEQLASYESAHPGFSDSAATFIDDLVSHYVLDGGHLVVAHAGMRESMQGRGSGAVRDFALYGETTGETDEFGLPIRYNWAAEYRGRANVVYGHTPVPHPEWLNHTINIDTGCVFGGSLTALRYPEKELVSVAAKHLYAEPRKPFLPAGTESPALSIQQSLDNLLDLADVSGKRIISTRLMGHVTIREENSAAALEIMSRFAANPKWLVYLPPTMSPAEASQREGLLEHPAEVFAYFRHAGVPRVICQEKHMGSRAIAIVCRDDGAAAKAFGIEDDGIGICLTRTGRRFFDDRAVEHRFLDRIREAAAATRLWEDFNTGWLCLDCEVMPWSAKARELLRRQYAPVGAAAEACLRAEIAALSSAKSRGLDVAALLDQTEQRQAAIAGYIQTYRRYCWPVHSIDDLKLAPFHLLACDGRTFFDRPHDWHLETLGRLAGGIIVRTDSRIVDLSNPQSEAAATEWWSELTSRGGEGIVVKPLDFISRYSKGIVQPALKCRGREYLRIIYGPEYTLPQHLERLRKRGLAAKRSLAAREFALGIEALERFVRKEPLRRVHEAVFGVLALESEPVDPRL